MSFLNENKNKNFGVKSSSDLAVQNGLVSSAETQNKCAKVRKSPLKMCRDVPTGSDVNSVVTSDGVNHTLMRKTYILTMLKKNVKDLEREIRLETKRMGPSRCVASLNTRPNPDCNTSFHTDSGSDTDIDQVVRNLSQAVLTDFTTQGLFDLKLDTEGLGDVVQKLQDVVSSIPKEFKLNFEIPFIDKMCSKINGEGKGSFFTNYWVIPLTTIAVCLVLVKLGNKMNAPFLLILVKTILALLIMKYSNFGPLVTILFAVEVGHAIGSAQHVSCHYGDFSCPIADCVSHTEEASEGMEPQGNIFGTEYITALGRVFVGEQKVPPQFWKLLKNFGEIPKLKSATDITIDIFFKSVQYISDVASNTFGWERIEIIENPFPQAAEFLNEVRIVVKDFDSGEAYSREKALKLFNLNDNGYKILTTIRGPKHVGEARNLVQQGLSMLKPILEKLDRSSFSKSGPRMETASVLLGGGTQVGKSFTANKMAIDVLVSKVDLDRIPDIIANHHNFIFVRSTGSKFFDDYRNQELIIFDDWGQAKSDSTGEDAVAMEHIRGINTMPYPLNRADVSDKGKDYWHFKYAITTTNLKQIRPENIVLPEALIRRFHLAYWQTPKIEFCLDEYNSEDITKRRLDPLKVEDYGSQEVLEWHPWDFSTGCRAEGPAISYEELLAKCESLIERKEYEFKQMCDMHLITKRDALRRRRKDLSEEQIDAIMQSVDFDAFDAKVNSWSERLGIRGLLDIIKRKWNGDPDKIDLDDIDDMCRELTWTDFHESKSYFTQCADGAFLYPRNLKFMAGLGGIIAAAWALYNVVDAVFLNSFKRYDMQSDVRAKKVRDRRPKKKVSEYFIQGNINVNCAQFAQKVYRRNTYRVILGESVLGVGIFIKDRIFMLPCHFVDEWCRDFEESGVKSDLVLVAADAFDRKITIPFGSIPAYIPNDGDEDVAFLYVSGTYAHSDVSVRFVKENQIRERNLVVTISLASNASFSMTTTPAKRGPMEYAGYHVRDGFFYSAPTKKGDCGNPIYLSINGVNDPYICGIHVAGNNKDIGYGRLVSAAFICDALSHFESRGLLVSVPLDLQSKGVDIPDLDVQFQPQMDSSKNVLGRAWQPRMPLASKIIRSPLWGKIRPSECSQAHLSKFWNDGELIDPWSLALAKYSKSIPSFDVRVMDECFDHYYSNFVRAKQLSGQQPWEPRVFTFEEAVAGVPGVPFMAGISRSTSPGYPWVKDNKQGGKKQFFGEEGEYDFTSYECDRLRESVDFVIDKARKGYRVPSIYIDTLKDERRPIEKVKVGKTRMFSAIGLVHLIIFRMYFMDAIRCMHDCRIDSDTAMGVNPVSPEWHKVYSKLTKNGLDSVFAGDFSNFDGSIFTSLMYYSLVFFQRYYWNAKEDDKNIRTVIFEELTNSHHIFKGYVVDWAGSLPSGTMLTTPVNSITGNIILRYACYKVFLESSHLDVNLYEFLDQFSFLTYGDDNIVSSPTPLVNPVSVGRELRKIGFGYTSEDKGELQNYLRPITKCTFLKRGFRYDSDLRLVVAPLALDTILEAPMWTKTDAPEGSLEETLDDMILELSLHGEEVFNNWAPKLRNVAEENLSYSSPHHDFILSRRKKMSEDRYL